MSEPWMPPETAVVLLEQRGFESIIANHFDEPPTEKTEALKNEAFVKELYQRYAQHTERDAKNYLAFVGRKDIRSILDIGCGIALLDYFFSAQLSFEPMLYLLDGSGDSGAESEERIHYASGSYVDKYDEFTFRVDLTRKCMIRNGVPQDKVNFVAPSVDAIANLRKIDFVVSRASWGNHYPLTVYWDGVKKSLHKDSTLIVDIRDRENQLSFLKEHFAVVEHVEKHDHWSHWRIGCKEPKWL